MKYLKKEIKSRPSEKISNIVMSIKNNLETDNTKLIRVIVTIVALLLPLYIFKDPKILYEKVEGGYFVRYYIY